MRAFYDQLVIVLEDEVKVYRVLLDLVRREKEILTSTKLKDLEDCNRQKETLINKVKGLERIREKHAIDLAAAVGAQTESPRLLEIASKLLEPESGRLRSIHSTLDLLIRRIKEFNTENEALVETSLKAVSGILGAIKENLAPRKTYAPSGEVKKGDVAGHFVSKEV